MRYAVPQGSEDGSNPELPIENSDGWRMGSYNGSHEHQISIDCSDRNVGQSSWMGARMNPNNRSRNTMSIDDQDEEEDPEERVFESSTYSQSPGNIRYPVFNYLVHESTWGAAGSAYPIDNSRDEAGDNV